MKLTDCIVRRWKQILVAGLALTALAIWPASQLGVLTDVSALLPEGSRAATDYRMFLERFGGLEKVFVVIVSASDDGSVPVDSPVTDAAEELAILLAEAPEVKNVRSGIETGDERFILDHVLPRALLLAGGGWRETLERATTTNALRERAERIRFALVSPMGSLDTDYLATDPLGLASELSVLSLDTDGLTIDPSSLGYLSPDGRASLVIVTPARSEIDAEGGRELARLLESSFEAVRSNADGPIGFAAIGGPLYAAHDEEILRNDLNFTLSGAMLSCALLVVVAFGSFVLPLGTILSLSVGLVATILLLRFGLGSISSIGVGFGAVLVGLGLDYGIHGSTRFCQRRIEGDDTAVALDRTFRSAGPGIVTSALTTAAAFAVLTLSRVRPIWELGLVVSLGIVAILVSSATIGAACLVGADRGQRIAKPSGVVWRFLGRVVDGCVRVAVRRSTTVIVLAVATTGVAVWGLTLFRFTPDLQSLRPTHHPTVAAEKVLMEHFPVGLDTATIVVSNSTLSRALEDAARAERVLLEALGEDVAITSPTTWLGVPSVVDERLSAFGEVPLESTIDEFERTLRSVGLDPRGFARGLEALRTLGNGRDPGLPPREEWPDWLGELVRVDDDQVSIAVRVRLRNGVWPDGPTSEILRRLDEQLSRVAVASVPAVGRELRELAQQDLRRLGGGAALAVLVVVLISFRGRIGPTVLSLTPVLLGTVWVLGLWSLMGFSLEIFGVAVLPIILGIGVDDGLHSVHGAARGTTRPIAASVRESGRALLLTTLTTALGFGCLALSHLPGLRRGGILVSCGVLACLAATIFVLPALESLFNKRP
jgi:predicted RND superfamily exporter protein